MDEKVFIDANIFLEIFLGDEKCKLCENYLNSLKENKIEVVTSDFIVYSCILLVQNKLDESGIVSKVAVFFNSYPVKILRPSLGDIYDAAQIMKKSIFDFDDALVLACMKNNNIKKLASMDKHFDKVKWIDIINFR